VEERDCSGRIRQVKEPSGHTDPVDASLGLGVFLLAISAAALILSRGIETLGFAREGDPGSKAFPCVLAALLVFGGVWEIVRWRRQRRHRGSAGGVFAEMRLASFGDVGALGVSLAVYAWLLGPLGFASSTLLLCAPWMRRFGSGWKRSLIATTVLVVCVEILFAGAFQVRLPEGSTILAIDRFMVNL